MRFLGYQHASFAYYLAKDKFLFSLCLLFSIFPVANAKLCDEVRLESMSLIVITKLSLLIYFFCDDNENLRIETCEKILAE